MRIINLLDITMGTGDSSMYMFYSYEKMIFLSKLCMENLIKRYYTPEVFNNYPQFFNKAEVLQISI